MKYVHALTAVCIALSAICAAAAVLLVPGHSNPAAPPAFCGSRGLPSSRLSWR